QEVENLVMQDRATDAAAVLGLIKVADFRIARPFAHIRRAALRVKHGSVESVRSRAGHGIDAAAGESALPHVVGRDDDLQLLDRVERERLRAGPSARRTAARQTE